ncbi:MAG TPA: hypothetical protein VGR89_08120, partial [Puia sp.]|nr:hypothetical protein [Puia sp.]
MSEPTVQTPLISTPWLRILLFGCCFCVMALLLGIPAILLVTKSGFADLKKESFLALSNLMA